VYGRSWKTTLESDRPQTTIWRMRIACWITKATNQHREYVVLTAFPLQQLFRERASILRYMYCTLPVSYLANSQAHPHAVTCIGLSTARVQTSVLVRYKTTNISVQLKLK